MWVDDSATTSIPLLPPAFLYYHSFHSTSSIALFLLRLFLIFIFPSFSLVLTHNDNFLSSPHVSFSFQGMDVNWNLLISVLLDCPLFQMDRIPLKSSHFGIVLRNYYWAPIDTAQPSTCGPSGASLPKWLQGCHCFQDGVTLINCLKYFNVGVLQRPNNGQQSWDCHILIQNSHNGENHPWQIIIHWNNWEDPMPAICWINCSNTIQIGELHVRQHCNILISFDHGDRGKETGR